MVTSCRHDLLTFCYIQYYCSYMYDKHRHSSMQVSRLLRDFMLNFVTPELRKDGGGKSYIKDPLNAAVIMLYVWRNFRLPLDYAELARLCVSLCLPDLPKDKFLPYWQEFQQSFFCLKEFVPFPSFEF